MGEFITTYLTPEDSLTPSKFWDIFPVKRERSIGSPANIADNKMAQVILNVNIDENYYNLDSPKDICDIYLVDDTYYYSDIFFSSIGIKQIVYSFSYQILGADFKYFIPFSTKIMLKEGQRLVVSLKDYSPALNGPVSVQVNGYISDAL